MGEVNTLVPVASPELPPVASYRRRSSSLPCLSLCRAGPACQQPRAGGSRPWAVPFLDRAECAGVRVAGRRVLSGRPSSRVRFSFLFVYPFSQICVHFQKYVSPCW